MPPAAGQYPPAPAAPTPYGPYQQFPPPFGGGWAPGGFPQWPTKPPGTVTTARVLLFVFGGLVAVFCAAGLSVGLFGDPDPGDMSRSAVLILVLVVGGLLGAPALVAASLFNRGRTGVRALANVAGSVMCLLGVASLPGGPVGLFLLTGGVLVIVFVSNSAASSWFKRPRAETK